MLNDTSIVWTAWCLEKHSRCSCSSSTWRFRAIVSPEKLGPQHRQRAMLNIKKPSNKILWNKDPRDSLILQATTLQWSSRFAWFVCCDSRTSGRCPQFPSSFLPVASRCWCGFHLHWQTSRSPQNSQEQVAKKLPIKGRETRKVCTRHLKWLP